MKRILFQLLLVLLMTASSCVSGCTHYYDPPTPEEADAFLKKNQPDIDLVVDCLRSIDAESAHIDRNSTTIWYAFEHHDILEQDVIASLQRLWKAGCEAISIDHRKNTISFEIWYRTRGDIGCGIACPIDGQGYPKAEMQTECTPISGGWFHYVADYEKYRISPSKYDEMWDAETNQTP